MSGDQKLTVACARAAGRTYVPPGSRVVPCAHCGVEVTVSPATEKSLVAVVAAGQATAWEAICLEHVTESGGPVQIAPPTAAQIIEIRTCLDELAGRN